MEEKVTVETVEALLREQQKENKKLKRIQGVLSLVMVFFLLVFSLGIWQLNRTVAEATQGLPQLVDTTTVSVQRTAEELQSLLVEINAIDFKELARTIEQAGNSVDSLDMEALNQSIQSLHQVSSRLALFFGMGGA